MNFFERLLDRVHDFRHFDFRHYVKAVIGHSLFRFYSDSGDSGWITSSPRTEPERKRTGFAWNTGCAAPTAFAAAFTGAAIDSSEPASGFFAASVDTTRLVISSTMNSIEASRAIVTAARICSLSITATNGTAEEDWPA